MTGAIAPPLRPYQERAIESGRESHRNGHRRIIYVSPTGSGKTRLGAELVRLAARKEKNILWLASRRELIHQAHATIESCGVPAGILMACSEQTPGRVQVASVPTLISQRLRPPADLIVVDECHHSIAARTAGILRDYPRASVIGLTATPERTDGRGLGEIFTDMIIVAQIREMVDAGYMVPMRVMAAEDDPGKTISARPVDAYIKHAAGTSAIVFSGSVAGAHACAEEFRAQGINAQSVDSASDPSERDRHVAAFRAGELQVLTNYNLFGEGTDIPRVSTIILARKVASPGFWIQLAGRAGRPFPGKSHALILDLAGVAHMYGHPYEPRTYSLTGAAISRVTMDADMIPFCRVCGCQIVPGLPCPDCGTATLRPRRQPRVRAQSLVDFESIRNRPPGKRAIAYAGFILDARARGYKIDAAKFKFRSAFGYFPNATISAMAEMVLDAKSDSKLTEVAS